MKKAKYYIIGLAVLAIVTVGLVVAFGDGESTPPPAEEQQQQPSLNGFGN